MISRGILLDRLHLLPLASHTAGLHGSLEGQSGSKAGCTGQASCGEVLGYCTKWPAPTAGKERPLLDTGLTDIEFQRCAVRA